MVKREISSVKNWKEAFWETALCSVNSSHRVTASPLKKPFAKTVLVEFAKWYFETLRRLWWKWKYPKAKTVKKLSEKRLCILLVNSQIYSLPLKYLSLRLFLWNLQSDFLSLKRATMKKEISSVKYWKEAFWETALYSVTSSHRVTAFPSRSLSLGLFLCHLESGI